MVPGLSLHDVTLGSSYANEMAGTWAGEAGESVVVGYSRPSEPGGGRAHHVGAQVDAEDGDGAQRQWDGHDEQQEGCDLWDVAGQGVAMDFFRLLKISGLLQGTQPSAPMPGHPSPAAPSYPV